METTSNKTIKQNFIEALDFFQAKQAALQEHLSPTTIAQYPLRPLKPQDLEALNLLYQSYHGLKEFLYVPSKQELAENLISDKKLYVGYEINHQLVGVMKIEHYSENSDFFTMPAFEQNQQKGYLGLSGLLVKENFGGHSIGSKLTQAASVIAHRTNLAGIYADCDYRNQKSFHTLIKHLDFVGFTDGRAGRPGEQTIYTTFYHSCSTDDTKKSIDLILDYALIRNKSDVVEVLKKKMNELGGYNIQRIPLEQGYNDIYVLNNSIRTPRIKTNARNNSQIILPEYTIVPYNFYKQTYQGR